MNWLLLLLLYLVFIKYCANKNTSDNCYLSFPMYVPMMHYD